ncbi:MAG TPA: type II CAAX endopeptidase family protein [Gemmataceae bacterium]|nr:type II CAAX endopeptidase family protein [Gemmataceae bacterium]
MALLDEQPDDEPEPVLPVPEPVRCWRCERLEVPRAGRCPKCGARVAASEPRRRRSSSRRPAHAEPNPLKPMLVVYAVMLALSVVWGWMLMAGGAKMSPDAVTAGTAVLGILDGILVLVGIGVVGWTPLPGREDSTRAAAWLIAWPALALLLGLNLLYFEMLREYLGVPRGKALGGMQLDVVTILLVCVQPSIVEELFFRYLALGVLFRVTGLHTAVVVSSVMFAMIHIYNPIGTPYLFVAGVAFGYARVYGGLALPMALHFVHNFAVTAIEVAR